MKALSWIRHVPLRLKYQALVKFGVYYSALHPRKVTLTNDLIRPQEVTSQPPLPMWHRAVTHMGTEAKSRDVDARLKR